MAFPMARGSSLQALTGLAGELHSESGSCSALATKRGMSLFSVSFFCAAGLIPTLLQIGREEGLAGLTRGMGPRMVYSALFSATGFFAFETSRAFLTRAFLEYQARQKAEEAEARGATAEEAGSAEGAREEAAATGEEAREEGAGSAEEG